MTTRAAARIPSTLAACSALLLAASPASANGQFPAADHILVAPGDPSHLLVRTTFGLLVSSNAGADWDWICETAALYSNFSPAVALTGDGTAILALLNGLGEARGDLCDFHLSGAPLDGQFVTDVTIAALAPENAFAVTAQGGVNVSKLWASSDNASTWAQAGVDMPTNFLAKTVDVAPTDPARVYVSGSDTSTGVLLGRLGRSDDGGQSWQLFDIPGAGVGAAPYIAAIDPNDEDTVYVRLDGAPGKLLVSNDAGQEWHQLFSTMGFLMAFALSPDGSKVLAGGDLDGLYRAAAGSTEFEKVSSVGSRCLRWTAAGVYTCADETNDGFTVGLSHDEGETFEPLLHLPCLRGPLACDPATTVGVSCPGEWPTLATKIATENCVEGTGGAGGAGGSGGGAPSTTSDGPTTTTSGAGGASGAGTSTTSAGGAAGGGSGGSDDGCSCGVAGGGGRSPGAFAAIAAAAALVTRRRRRATPRGA